MGLVNESLSRLFHGLGERIGRSPKGFILGSILVSLALGTGLLRLRYENNVEKLFTNTHGPYEVERETVEKYFPSSGNGTFDPSRAQRIGRFARMIILAKDGGTLFRRKVWDEILEMDAIVQSTAVQWKHEGRRNYSSLCGRWEAECFENKFLDLGQVMDRIENGSLKVNYPFMLNPETYNSHVMALHFGGVELSNDTYYATKVTAVNLAYFLTIDNDEDDDRGYAWESEVLKAMEAKIPELKHITVYRQTFKSLAREADLNILSLIPYISVTIVAMGLFLSLTSLSRDWVRAKPWVALLGMFCAGMGTLSGCGLLAYIGIPFIGINAAVPFIMLGIGIDDTFVILAAWRQTNPLDSVPTRLAECYSEAAVSITITTLTDMLSFYVGIWTPIPSVQIFSAYAGTCVFWIYIMQVFLFGGILAISGGQEAGNWHSVFWWIEATPKSKAESKSKMFQIFFTGGIDKSDPTNLKDRPQNAIMVFFRDYYAPFLSKSWVKGSVILTFLAYLAASAYGLTTLDEGLQIKRIYREDSYLYQFIEKEELYFRAYPFRIQILITGPIDYSNETVQNQIYAMLEEMTDLDTMTYEYSENWLKSYTRYIEGYGELFELNVTDKQSFIHALRNEYFAGSSSVFKEDVKFNEDFTEITASRFILQSRNLFSSEDEKRLVVALRAISGAQPMFNVTIFHPWFHFADQYLIIGELTVKLIATAAAIVMVVAVIFIPNLLCSFCVFLSIASIEIGVLGFMCLWGVSLDMISILCLIQCVGFSVDFSAHISYAYISTEGTAEERISKSMYSLGLPILQGGISTIIGVLALLIPPSYIFQTFFKIILLVILFAGWHGLFVLPVFLLIIKPERLSGGCSRKTTKFETDGNANDGFDNTRL